MRAVIFKILFLVFLMTIHSDVPLFAVGGTPYSFIRVDASDGLVNNQVTCIFKDSRGFIWIGTTAGLSRFDGTNFVNYTHNDKDPSSIIDNYIVDIKEDGNRRLWIETRWEHTIFDLNKEVFINNISGILNDFQVKGAISIVYIDKSNKLWFKPQGKNRFYIYDLQKGGLINPFKSKVPESIDAIDFLQYGNNYYFLYGNGIVECFDGSNFRLILSDDKIKKYINNENFTGNIFVDADGDIWVYGNNDGIYYFKSSSKQWSYYNDNSKDIRLTSNLTSKIIQDDKGLIWVGTDHGGIDIINKFSKNVQTIYYQGENLKSLPQNSITDIFIDNNNRVWIGTFKKGFCYYHESIHKFPLYQSIVSDKTSLPFNDVNCFAEEKSGNLWIGTNGGGLIYFDRKINKYSVYKHDANNENSISNDIVVSLFIDKENLLWIGTYTGGLNTFDGRKFTRYKASKESLLTNNSIWTITQDNKKRIWIGTLGSGIVLFDKNSKTFVPLPNLGSVKLPSAFVNQIFKMNNGNMLIATAVGVIFYDVEENRYRNHPYENKELPFQISNNNVNGVYEDSRGLFWIATREGLTMIDPNTNYIKIFRKEDGLPRDIMNCIQEDDYQSIWVSKSSGLSQIMVNSIKPGEDYSFSINNYTEADGLQEKEFNTNSGFKTTKGELIFGGPNGFNLFQTKNIKYNKNLPLVVFTDFQVLNQSVKVGDTINKLVILENSIVSTKDIVIKHSMNVFSIGFAALNSFISEKLKFKYQLEGFDKDWIEIDGNTHKVVYTNLNAGKYNFKIKACNNDGIWNENYTELKITILPPFFASPLAYVLYFIIIVLALIYFRYSMLKKERFKFKMEQERMISKQNHELDEMKLRFLTNVSHEFRTPLTLILTPLEKLIKMEKSNSELKLLETINRNAHNLLDLVNQLLDFRKLDLYGLKYQPSYGDLISFLNEVCGNFLDSFSRKGVKLEFISSMNQFYFEFDSNKLQKIMMNLISNALKFTREGGSVKVVAELQKSEPYNEEQIVLSVIDNGVGIKEEEIDKIFDRFYQSQSNVSLGISGSGIGLNLAKEMVNLHGGTLSVKSKPGIGSEFIVSLPVLPSIKIRDEKHQKEELQIITPAVSLQLKETNGIKPIILLIEDNFEFRTFMKDSLENQYIVNEANDGIEGYEIVNKIIPDLIISDVMMPRMDGLELCRKLKSDIHTSHIPLILLTARTADEDKIQGLEIGADDYITKPFNMDLLFMRIENLMDKRRKIQKHFQNNIDISPSDIEIPSMDEKLIKKAVAFVSKNIAEPNLSVEDLSREVGMSRVYLYKKLLAITGKSPIEFIRIIRLKRGTQLLEKSQMSVSEVAYAVGFNSPRYFSKYFNEEYGMLPKDYAGKFRKNSIDKIDIE